MRNKFDITYGTFQHPAVEFFFSYINNALVLSDAPRVSLLVCVMMMISLCLFLFIWFSFFAGLLSAHGACRSCFVYEISLTLA